MSQHQKAFLADNQGEVDRVARLALAVLAQGKAAKTTAAQACENSPEFKDIPLLVDPLFEATFSHIRSDMDDAIRTIRSEGVSDRTLLFEVVPKIARQLGRAWENDSLSFGAVTIGCARLQTLVSQLGQSDIGSQQIAKKIACECLVVVPEKAQHTLGAIVLTKQLRNSGHNVRLHLGGTPEAQSKQLQTHQIDAIMISASKSESPEILHTLVKASQAKGANSKVFIGGGILELHTDLVAMTGTDYVTNDWEAALDLCLARS